MNCFQNCILAYNSQHYFNIFMKIESNTVIIAEVLEVDHRLIVDTVELLLKRKNLGFDFFIPMSSYRGKVRSRYVYKITEKGMEELREVFSLLKDY